MNKAADKKSTKKAKDDKKEKGKNENKTEKKRKSQKPRKKKKKVNQKNLQLLISCSVLIKEKKIKIRKCLLKN